MIDNFREHAANERTFLAWVRTAIAIMAFGFLVEKFDLFLLFAAPAMAGKVMWGIGRRFGDVAGLTLVILGIVMIALAAWRFLRTAKSIDSPAVHPGTGSRVDLALAGLLLLLGCALFFYLTHDIVTQATTPT